MDPDPFAAAVAGASTRDIVPPVSGPVLEGMIWARYRQGEQSLEGWLIEYTQLYRYHRTRRHARLRGTADMAGLDVVQRRQPTERMANRVAAAVESGFLPTPFPAHL